MLSYFVWITSFQPNSWFEKFGWGIFPIESHCTHCIEFDMHINQVTPTTPTITMGDGNKLSTEHNTKKPKPTRPTKDIGEFKGNAKSNSALFRKIFISRHNQPVRLISIRHALSSYVWQNKGSYWYQCLREIETKDQDFFMPIRTDRTLYDIVAADNMFIFTNFNIKDDYTKEKELWK